MAGVWHRRKSIFIHSSENAALNTTDVNHLSRSTMMTSLPYRNPVSCYALLIRFVKFASQNIETLLVCIDMCVLDHVLSRLQSSGCTKLKKAMSVTNLPATSLSVYSALDVCFGGRFIAVRRQNVSNVPSLPQPLY